MADGGWRIVLVTHRTDHRAAAGRDPARPRPPAGGGHHRPSTTAAGPAADDRRVGAARPGRAAARHQARRSSRCCAPTSPDLLLCWGFPWKIPLSALQVPRLGSVNCHPALLPRHRGPVPLAWALREGDGQYGVTWHRMDAELDTGAILAQAVVPMEDDDFEITVVGPRMGARRAGPAAAGPGACRRRRSGRPAAVRRGELGRSLRRRLRHGRLVAAGAARSTTRCAPGPSPLDFAGDRADRRDRWKAGSADPHKPGRSGWRRATGRGRRRADLGRRQRAARGERARRPGPAPPRTSAAGGRRTRARPGPASVSNRNVMRGPRSAG